MQEILEREAAAHGLSLNEAHLTQFETYYRELVAWNARFNLTRITAYDQVQVQHFLDSLAVLIGAGDAFPTGAQVIDVGTGAGLPGVALKIARPDLRVTLADSVGKKVQFLEHLIETLGLADTRAIHARAEDLGQALAHRAVYEVAVARAVADLSVELEYLLPLLKVGGGPIAPNAAHVEEEVGRAAKAIRTLGGGAPRLAEYTLPGLDDPRTLVILHKVKPTPPTYPRRAGLPSQEPLR
jgi:16S rRNA (guanine527-N7)-methyltransferase